MTTKNYVTSISVNNDTRNKLIALATIRGTTQKSLLTLLVNKEIDQLNSADKDDFAYIFNATKTKDSFRNNKERGNNNDKETR